MSLYSYVVRLEDTLRSRKEITLHKLDLTVTVLGVIFEADVHFYDGSQLSILEEVQNVGPWDTERIRYKFHYQQPDGTLIFRYDSSPHYPHLSTFPHHKHVGNSVYEAEAPDLSEVLQEIDTLIYPKAS
ncbi:MAG: toxin-antitoxin system TumE family protein [Ardenticatenaceae bacterium]